jgi:hypothetical protein
MPAELSGAVDPVIIDRTLLNVRAALPLPCCLPLICSPPLPNVPQVPPRSVLAVAGLRTLLSV